MSVIEVPKHLVVDKAFVAATGVLLAWALHRRFWAASVPAGATDLVLVCAVLFLSSAAPLVRSRFVRNTLMVAAFALLAAFVAAR